MEQIVIRLLSGYYVCRISNGRVQTKSASRIDSMENIVSIISKQGQQAGLLSPIKRKEDEEYIGITIVTKGHALYDEAMKAKAVLAMSNSDAERETQIGRIKEKIIGYEDAGEIIIKSALLIEDLTRAKSMLSNRLRNMLGAYYPEPAKEIEDSVALARLFIDEEEGLKRTPFARPMDNQSRQLLKNTASKIMDIDTLVEESQELTGAMLKKSYPAFTLIATEKIAARILREAGSMREIAFMPASKLQLIGAEKALFRHLRNKKNLPPKHGIIHEHPMMQSLPFKSKGKAARLIADKMAIAARLDYFQNHDKKTIKDIEEDMARRISALRGAS
jgi:RNA processing factor Prp31